MQVMSIEVYRMIRSSQTKLGNPFSIDKIRSPAYTKEKGSLDGNEPLPTDKHRGWPRDFRGLKGRLCCGQRKPSRSSAVRNGGVSPALRVQSGAALGRRKLGGTTEPPSHVRTGVFFVWDAFPGADRLPETVEKRTLSQWIGARKGSKDNGMDWTQ